MTGLVKRFVIVNLTTIKELMGTETSSQFTHREEFKTARSGGNCTFNYPLGDVFSTLAFAKLELGFRRKNRIDALMKRIEKLQDDETISILNESESLYYSTTYLKDEKGFEFSVVE